ncbi:MAG: FG-GAP-like repeat-containing protein, partial [Candidatus Latescibacterota bacterium]
LLNDGHGHFLQEMTMAPELIEEKRALSAVVAQVPRERVSGILWESYPPEPGQGYKVTYLSPQGDVTEEALATDVVNYWIRYVGDFDQDGDTDLVIAGAVGQGADRFRGLDLLVNPGDGRLARVPWYGAEVSTPQNVQYVDLDGDGLLDPVFVDRTFRGPAVVVGVGQPSGLPIQEGRYPLEGPGGEVIAGDVDGDGDTDLVVLESSHTGSGSGVYVLNNRLAERRTAVAEAASPGLPIAFHLGPNYPNPFNPQTCIPVEIPASTEATRLQVYNLLGQPIRTLVNGSLTPGYHAVPWDGRNERGTPVSSGVYVYRLDAGTWSATGRMVKTK